MGSQGLGLRLGLRLETWSGGWNTVLYCFGGIEFMGKK
jgi:hypothetical protein